MSESEPWSGLLSQVADLRPGDRAELRRWRPERSDRKALSPAFWRLYLPRITAPEDRGPRTEEVHRWALLLAVLAETAGLHRGPSLGRALAAAGFSEPRLVRLLDAPEGSPRNDALLKAAGFLAAKSQDFRAADLIRLVLTTDPDKAERLHLQIARDYYAGLDAAAQGA